MKGPLGNLMQQAQRMQENLKRAQDEIAAMEINGQAGAGMVSVLINGRHEVKRADATETIDADADGHGNSKGDGGGEREV